MNAQHMGALATAQHNRLKQAAWRQHIASKNMHDGVAAFQTALRDDDLMQSAVGGMRVSHALSGLRTVGPKKVEALLADIGVRSADKRLRDLTGRQREELALALGLRLVTYEQSLARWGKAA